MQPQTTDPELQTIESIITMLAPLRADRKIAVLNYVYERLGGQHSVKKIQPHIRTGAEDEGSIKEFLEQKSPKTVWQQITVLAYFLLKNREIEEVNKNTLNEANKEAGGPIISNIGQALIDGINKWGLFGRSAKGTGRLLALGEKVVNALPDQEEVKKIMKNRRTKAKKSKKT